MPAAAAPLTTGAAGGANLGTGGGTSASGVSELAEALLPPTSLRDLGLETGETARMNGVAADRSTAAAPVLLREGGRGG